MAVKGWIEVNLLFCKGCELCVNACPQQVLALDMDRLTPKGFHPISLVKEGCTGCAICAVVCPDSALTVFRQVPVRAVRAEAIA
jgi:2-oxoglutarate ferredoxin oxidoreductase subunit delta